MKSLKKRSKILIIDDQNDLFQKFQKFIYAHDLEQARTLQEASAKLNRNFIDLAVVDLKLNSPDGTKQDHDFKGLDYIRKIKSRNPSLPVMVISSYRDINHILTAGNYMADEYLWKEALDFTDYRFIERINSLIKRKKQQDKIKSEANSRIWGNSQIIHSIKNKLQGIAKSRQSFVLLGGEGAKLINWVYFLHHSTHIEKEPQIADLSYWSESEILNILNGHGEIWPKGKQFQKTNGKGNKQVKNKTSSIHSVAQHKGIDFLRNAHKHILFVPHLDRLSRNIQSAFLQLIESRNFLKVSDPNRLDIQFVFSSHIQKKDLIDKKMIDSSFLEDFPIIEIPPLHTRKDDIKSIIEEWTELKDYSPKLIQHFTNRFLQYPYLYNESELLSQLDSIFEHHRTQFKGRTSSGTFAYMEKKVTEASLPKELTHISPKKELSSIDIAVAELELDYLEQALIQFNGNKSKSAEALNNRNTGQLHHLIKKYKERYPELIRQYPMICYIYKIT